MRTFTFAGSSVLNGKLKVRYANDILRVKTLEKAGHTAIDLQPMPEAMTKLEIVTYMLDTDFAGEDTELKAVIAAELARLQGKRKPAETPAAPVELSGPDDEDESEEDADDESDEAFYEVFDEDEIVA